MLITLDLTEPMVANSALDATIYSQALTDLTFSVQNPQEADLNGLSCVLLSTDGVTLAHAIISENKAVLNTNTTECIDYVSSLQVDAKNTGYLVIGESERPRAIVAVEVAKNFISNSAPPQSVAGIYPTTEVLKAILAQMTAQAQRAEDAVQATEEAQKAVAEYVDVTFPTKVEQAERSLANATAKGVQAVTDKATQSVNSITSHTTTIIGALDTKKTAIETSIDAKAQAVNTALDSKITSANTALDGKVSQAEQSRKDAETAKTQAETAKGQAQGFAKDASTSASNASTSATNAKTAEANAKASAVQAENATALKVDKRINTADNSEYPLIVMVDKDVYKFIAPKGLTKTNAVRYCCDGFAHYFVSQTHFYEYDSNLKFVKRMAFNFGYIYYEPSQGYRDFVTRIGDFYYLYSRQRLTVTKVYQDGTVIASVTLHGDTSSVNNTVNYAFQLFRNERSGNLIVLGKNANGEGVYWVYDKDLVELGEYKIPCTMSTYPYHFNITDNVTFITFAPSDETKNGVYFFDEKDSLVEVTVTEIRGRGSFTSTDLTSTGRTSANYSIPRIFYAIQYRGLYHILYVFNGAKLSPLIVHPKTDGKPVTIENHTFNGTAIGGIGNTYIKESNVPTKRLTDTSVIASNGSGNYGGTSTWYQPFACIANGIVTKPYMVGTNTSYTDFAPDPFENYASIKPSVMTNTHPVMDKTAVTNKWHLYPAGDYNNIGGAIMITL